MTEYEIHSLSLLTHIMSGIGFQIALAKEGPPGMQSDEVREESHNWLVGMNEKAQLVSDAIKRSIERKK